MKKKWTIATVLLLAVALLAVGTWAYFSAVGTADNVITMGSVKLALHDEDGNGNPFTTVRVVPAGEKYTPQTSVIFIKIILSHRAE